jgi:O-antigen ligase
MTRWIARGAVVLFALYAALIVIYPMDNQAYAGLTGGDRYPGLLLAGGFYKGVLLLFGLTRVRTILRVYRSLSTPAIAFCLIAAASSLWSIDPLRTLSGTLDIVLIIAYAAIAVGTFGPQRAIAYVWMVGTVIVLVSVLLAASGSPYGVMTGGELAGLWRGLFDHKNEFGAFCGTMLLLTLFGGPLLGAPRSVRLASAAVCVVGLLGADSTTALLSTVFCIVVGATNIGLSRLRRLRSEAIVLALILLPTLALTLWLILPAIVEATGKDLTLTGRTGLWAAVLPLTQAHPFGAGYGTSGVGLAVPLMRQQNGWLASTTHNSYIALALDLGWLASIAFGVWVARLMLVLRRRPTAEQTLPICLSTIAGYQFIEGLSESSYGPYLSFNLFLLMLLLTAFRYRRRALAGSGRQAAGGNEAPIAARPAPPAVAVQP